MPYFSKSKILFIHIPKTGGTSVEELLNNSDINLFSGKINNKRIVKRNYKLKPKKKKLVRDEFQHMTARELFVYNLNINYSFSFIRNPYSRTISSWKYQNKFKVNFERRYRKINYKVPKYFDKWVENLYQFYKSGKLDKVRHNMPQYKYIFDSKQRLMVDEIFAFENIDTFEFKGKKLGVANKSSNNEEIIIKPEIAKMIREIYSKDFELLNY